MNHIMRCCMRIALLCILCNGCSKALIRGPLIVSNGRWQITIEALAQGPHQYYTAGGYREPHTGKCFLWATVRIRNGLKTDQVFLLDRVALAAGGKLIKPFIIDMNSALTMRANAAPKLAPGEHVRRRLIYMLPVGIVPKRLIYENTDIVIPAIKQ